MNYRAHRRNIEAVWLAVCLATWCGGHRVAAQSASPLHGAAARGDTAALGTLLAQHQQVDQFDAAGETPLVHALRHGRLEAARMLLDAGAAADEWETRDDRVISPLMIAVERDDLAAVELLIERGAGVQWTGRRDLDVFADASKLRDLDRLNHDDQDPPKFKMVELERAVDLAAERGAAQILVTLLSYRAVARMAPAPQAADHPLVVAAYQGDAAEVDRLLWAADTQALQPTLLVRAYQLALQQGHIDAAVTLAPVARERVLQRYAGQAAAAESVIDAVQSKDYRRVVVALLRGGDPNEAETVSYLRNRRPLHVAAANADLDIVQLLLRHGADPRLRDYQNRTVLEVARTPEAAAVVREAMTALDAAAAEPAAPGAKP